MPDQSKKVLTAIAKKILDDVSKKLLEDISENIFEMILDTGLFDRDKNTGKCRTSVRISKLFCFEYALHA